MNHRTRFAGLQVLVVTLLLFVTFTAGAQDIGSDQDLEMDLDALFGDEVVEEASSTPLNDQVAAAASSNPVTSALTSETVRIGGSFSGSLSPSVTWTDLWGGGSPFLDPDETSLDLSLKSTLYFDARPKEDFRVHGSVKTGWPFSTTKTFLTSTTTSTAISSPNISIFELFADFSLNDEMYFRFGKSTVKWGVGYFWSPADVINIESINVLDADAQREGPVNMRINIPEFGTQNNFYLYTILDNSDLDFDTTALAAKAEVLLGNYEVGIGGYYRYDTAERAMLTLTGPVGDFDIFGEAMVSRGSAKNFVTDIQTTSPYNISKSSIADNRNNFYFSASTGFLYNNSNTNINAIGQYYYNGEGYSISTKDALVTKAKLAIASAIATLDQNAVVEISKSLASLIKGSGQHYTALNISKSNLFSEHFSASIVAVANLSDWSGIVKPTFNYAVHDNFSLALSPTYFFGPSDGEYAFFSGSNAVSLSLGATVSGAF